MSNTAEPSKAEWAIYITLTMFARHQQGHSEPVNRQGYEYYLGQAVGKLPAAETPFRPKIAWDVTSDIISLPRFSAILIH